jgi:hypothetical protein
MFIRKKTNKNGSVSVQIVSKIKGTNFIIKTVGVSKDLNLIDKFEADAQYEMENLLGLQRINFDLNKEQDFVYTFLNGIENFELVGPEMLLGKIFDEIGFNAIKDDLFRYFVITRLVYPVSKLKTVDYLYQYKGIHFDVSKIYRYLDI